MEQPKGDNREEDNVSKYTEDTRQGTSRDLREGTSQDKGLKLDNWQKDILKADGHICLCTGRQVGKTTILAIKACHYMMDNPESRVLVVSLTEDQAQLIIMMIQNYMETHYKPLLKVANKSKSQTQTKNKIMIKNKSQVLSRPVGQTGDAVRGFTGDVLIIDEAAKMNQYIFDSAKPTLLTTGGKIWMCSTPFGKQGYFYESWLNKHNRFQIFHISSEEVITNRPLSSSWTEEQRKGGLKMLEEEKLDMGEIAYAQEFLGQFMDDLRMFFSEEWIEKVCTEKRDRERRPDGRYFLGIDVARMGDDSSTFEIVERVSKNYIRQMENIVTKKQLTNQTFDRIVGLNKLWNFKKEGIGIDAGAGSLGVGLLDFLRKEASIGSRVVALNNRKVVLDRFNQETRGLLKEDMYDNLRALGERGFLKLLNDEDLKNSFRCVQIEHVIKEGMKTKVKIFGRDAHIVEGLIRAVWLANSKNINTFIGSL